MHRVITKFRDCHGSVIVERGPWHMSREAAEQWAETLEGLGYLVELEGSGGRIESGGGNNDLANALASMA